MHIVGIRLINWRCFKGEHELELEPITYSITAEDELDPDRSNWLGKSSFASSIVFALTGEFKMGEGNKQDTADSWIHGEEREGGVELELDIGAAESVFVSRLRTRGSATHLQVVLDDDTTLERDDAQRWIDEQVIDDDTLRKTSYFEQKKMDQFVTMSPSVRSDVVNTWFDLGWIQEAADYCSSKLNTYSTKDAQLRVRLEALGDDDVESLQAELPALQDAVTTAAELIERQREASEVLREWYTAKADADLCSKLLVELDAVKKRAVPAEVSKVKLELSKKKADGKHALYVLASKAENDASRLKRGEFDGECPVAGIKCPAKDSINADTKANKVRFDQAQKAKATAKNQYDACLRHQSNLSAGNKARSEWQAEIDKIEARLLELNDSVHFIARNPHPPKAEVDPEAAAKHAQALQSHAEKVAEVKVARQRAEQRRQILTELEDMKPNISAWREALLVLGRTGAQREIAEGSLKAIEDLANHALSKSSIDLTLRAVWSQETQKLADDCTNCGAAYPKSAAVKKCQRCNEPRGKKLDQKLRIKMSNTSGGADDLGGIFFQLAAARWLRQWYGLEWSVFVIDEPFGSLDRANTRGLARCFAQLLTEEFGAAQSFVIAHDSDIVESTEGRIHITSNDGASRVEVL